MIIVQNMMNMNQNMMYQQNMLLIPNNYQNINSANIDDCFNYNQKMESFIRENSIYCNFCKNQLPSFYQTILYSVPEILIIVLNREKEIEFRIKLEFPEVLDLSNYIIRKETGHIYNLYGRK